MTESSFTDDHATRIEALYQDRLVPCYAHRPAHLDAMFRATVQRRPEAQALEEGERRLSYAELEREVGLVAAGLAALGTARSDRVVLWLENRLVFVVTLLAIWRLGAIAVPVGTRQSAAELAYMLNQCGASGLVFESTLAERLPAPASTPGLRWKVDCLDSRAAGATPQAGASLPYESLARAPGVQALAADFSDQSAACIMYTSGTTGHPKGAVLTHLAFFHTARHYVHRFGYRADDRMLLVIPASHISGLLAAVVVTLQAGGCLVCLRHFNAEQVLAEMEARRITATVMVPAMYNLCLLQPEIASRDLSAWRIGHFGGAAMPEVSIERLARVLPGLALYNGFGATETTSAVALTERGDAARFPDSVGTLVPCVDIRVLDADGHEVPPGAAGELWIRSPGNAIGYWDQPEATRKAFVAGYWRSGDIGSVDAGGYLRVFDRIKDMINRGGYKVYCVELENCIQRHEGVVEVAAVASPCDVLGERIHVFLHAQGAIDADSVRQLCRSQLADYKTPDFITVSATPLPRNLNGKLVKAPLREAARAAAAARLLPR
ncbi:MAG: class I adenylate-forming enzyme family protein [Comamonas sp.]|uniref:class I adenylate-forming enzyme family protein n=1 Tax=Comamonas sp. TaxID=34028 RepID=UPI002FCB27F6